MALRRHFLFLQGNATPFYRRLGSALSESGHLVTRINFGGGDRLFWNGPGTIDYKGPAARFGAFVAHQLDRGAVTDIVLFGDCRPLHRSAIEAAKARGLRVNVFEEGYFRPHWITLERDGVNGFSRLPRDPDWYFAKAASLADAPGEPVEAVGSGLRRRILYDFAWQAANYGGSWRFPRFRTHRPYPIWAEYSTWATRLARLRSHRRHARKVIEVLGREPRPYFVFPLQLDTDMQVRMHSRFGRLKPAIETVIDSFARSAPPKARLIVKNHPLDNGWINYGRFVRQLGRRHDLGHRLVFMDGGDLDRLVRGSAGMVTINSTAGIDALRQGRPVIALGQAIYDMPGLTFQGGLDAFWPGPVAERAPDPALYAAFATVVTACCLVNGNFYTAEGQERALRGVLPRLLDDTDPLADAPARAAPSLQRAAS